MPQDIKVLAEARFDEKLKLYFFLYGCIILAATVIGIPLLLPWFFLGQTWARRYFDRLKCCLTERSLVVKKGVVFRREKTIPLDKIQDLSLHEGPIQRWLGLCALKVETAGQSSPQGAADAGLVGIADVIEFRDAVLEQRDLVALQPSAATTPPPTVDGGDPQELLREIRDSVSRIEKLLDQK